jgi:hypothetical protein
MTLLYTANVRCSRVGRPYVLCHYSTVCAASKQENKKYALSAGAAALLLVTTTRALDSVKIVCDQ